MTTPRPEPSVVRDEPVQVHLDLTPSLLAHVSDLQADPDVLPLCRAALALGRAQALRELYPGEDIGGVVAEDNLRARRHAWEQALDTYTMIYRGRAGR